MDKKNELEISSFIISEQGPRKDMEDTHVLIQDFLGRSDCYFGGVFDGHGGAKTAEYAASNLPVLFKEILSKQNNPLDAYKKAFNRIDREIIEFHDGAAVASFYIEGDQITLSNIGDSRVALIGKDRLHYITPLHRITDGDELKRVISLGAVINEPYVCMSDGTGLMITRALGSHKFREIGVISEPFVITKKIEKMHQFILTGTDGLWDYIDLESIRQILVEERSMDMALEEIFNMARPNDNFTAILLKIDSNEDEEIPFAPSELTQ